MALDIGALIAPLSDEEPSGPDLYGDYDRQAIEGAFDRSISEGETTTAPTDWEETTSRILAQLEKTRDLWLPVYLMRAGAQSGRFDLIVDGAELLARLVEDRWADVHPQLDEVGFIGRKAPCESLTRLGEFLLPLQQVPLIRHPRLGSFTGADFVRFEDEGPAADNFGLFRALIDATPTEEIEALVAQVRALDDAIRRTDAGLTANADGDTSTNFQPTYDIVRRMARAVEVNLPSAAEAEPDAGHDDGGAGPDLASGARGGGGSFSGAINNRDDVVRAIDSICAYYQRCEPGSPVPFALRRAREWISLDFIAVLEDIAPNSLDEASRVLKGQRSAAASDDSGGWGDSEDSSSDSSGW